MSLPGCTIILDMLIHFMNSCFLWPKVVTNPTHIHAWQIVSQHPGLYRFHSISFEDLTLTKQSTIIRIVCAYLFVVDSFVSLYVLFSCVCVRCRSHLFAQEIRERLIKVQPGPSTDCLQCQFVCAEDCLR